jgi:hypothetical protein
MSTLHAAWQLSSSQSEFSLLQILIFGAFCAGVAAFLTAIAGATKRASLRYQLRVARQSERLATDRLTLLQETTRAETRWWDTGT